VYALLALAVSLTFAVGRNFSFFLLAIFGVGSMTTGALLVDRQPIWVAIASAIVGGVLLGLAIDAISGWPARLRSTAPAPALAAGFGALALLLDLGARTDVGESVTMPLVRALHLWRFGSIDVLDSFVVVPMVCAGLLIVVYLALSRWRFGLAVRAVAEDPAAARATGVNAGAVVVATVALGSALASASGVAWFFVHLHAMVFDPTTFLFVLAAVLVGGATSPTGAVLGGVLVAVIEVVLGRFAVPPWPLAVLLAIVVVSCALWPRGLLPSRELRPS
jgi:branched-subunit amino acid ABC-type transport system permease component